MQKLYILQYEADGNACPYYLPQSYSPEEWEWTGCEPDPLSLEVKHDYASRITDQEIESIGFDFYGTDSCYASTELLEVCQHLSVNYRAIPIDIRLWNDSHPKKQYSVFLVASQISILDHEKSSYEIERVKETGEPMMNAVFPQIPIYSKISRFIPKDVETPHLFQCLDVFSLVCTETFRKEALKRQLRGLSFIPIDENYRYDPWAGW